MDYKYYIQRTSERIEQLKAKKELPVYKNSNSAQWWLDRLIQDNTQILNILFTMHKNK
jgi:hypothetical protein